MTKELLEQYPDICAEISALEADAKTPVTDTVTASAEDFPYTSRAVQIRGVPTIPAAIKHLERLKRQKAETEGFIRTLPNAKLRRIVTLRIVEGLDWKTVAARMGHRYSEASVKMAYVRIFK